VHIEKLDLVGEVDDDPSQKLSSVPLSWFCQRSEGLYRDYLICYLLFY
jgi:hypothetical protein